MTQTNTSTKKQPEVKLNLVLQTLTDINCVGGSRAANTVSTISFHFIHLTSIQLVVQADGSSTEGKLWNERNSALLLISMYCTQREVDHKRQLILGRPYKIILVKNSLRQLGRARHGDITTALLQYDVLTCGGSCRTFRRLILPFSSKAKLHLCRRKHVIMGSHLIITRSD